MLSTDVPDMGYDVRTRPGAWTAAQATRRTRIVWVWASTFFLGGAAILAAILVAHTSVVLVVSVAVLVGLLCSKRFADRYVDRTLHWVRGARAEAAVGHALTELRRDGWTLMHDVRQIGEGNIDHLASGPQHGVFLIETKARCFRQEALTKVKRQAAKVGRELGVWVTPVICIDERRGRPFTMSGVAVVPRERLLEWLRTRRNRPVSFERLAGYADRVPDV